MIRTLAQSLGLIGLTLGLTSCFLIGSPPNTYSVSVVVIPPEGIDPICYELSIVAVLGQNTILEAVRNLDDGIGYASGSEARESGAQPYFVGMPLDVYVSCRDQESTEVGSSRYSAILTDTSSNAHFTVWNYVSEELEEQCVESAEHTGVRLCATIAEGFAVAPGD